MTLNTRRILSLVFILAFIIITPAIMLYAAGFRLAKNKLSVQRTGLFILDSQPEGAKILIDGQPQQSWLGSVLKQNNYLTTPAKVKNILPGEYDVSIELPGYWPWRKKLTINSGAATFAENVFLFKNDLPGQIASAQIKALSLSPDKNQMIILSPDQLAVINLAEETKTIATSTGLKGNHIFWSSDQTKFVIDNFLYDLKNLNSRLDLNKITAQSFNFKWSGNILYYQDKNSVYQLGADNAVKKIISNVTPQDFLIKEGYLYLININKTKKTADLKISNLANGSPLKDINLPFPAQYSFINQENSLLNIFDNQNQTLYLLNPLASVPQLETIKNVSTAIWLNSDELLYFNDYEIWLYHHASRDNALITRISEPITAALMHPNKNYLIYSTNQTINSIELDQREKRNTTQLLKFDKIYSLYLSSDGKIIYFTGRIGNAEGLYKLLLQ